MTRGSHCFRWRMNPTTAKRSPNEDTTKTPLGPTAIPKAKERSAVAAEAPTHNNRGGLDISKIDITLSLLDTDEKSMIPFVFNPQKLKKIFQKIQVIRGPKHRLATFGSSRIQYQLVTDVPGFQDRSRLRLGIVTAQKPVLITPQTLKEQFQGFGDDVKEYAETLISQYGKALHGLEYQFSNEISSTRIELSPPEAFAETISKEFDRTDSYDTALIYGDDRMWELSIMKFIIEETMASFATNVQELKERGFFDGEERHHRNKRREIDQLFKLANKDKSAIPVLGSKLKEYGLFDRYQDAFFNLVNS